MIRKSEYPPDQYGEYLRTHHRRNVVVNVLDVSLFVFAMQIVSASVVLPALAVRLGASDLVIALLPAIRILGTNLPQVAVSFVTEGRIRHKPWCMFFGIPQRLPWLAMGVLVLWLGVSDPGLMVWLLVACVLIANLAFGFNGPAYGELIAKTIPAAKRGGYMATISAASGALGVLAGLIVKLVMDGGWFAYPANYAALFFIASGVLWISFYMFYLNREPILWPARREKTFGDYLRALPTVLKTDHSFRRLILANILAQGSVMGIAFFMAHGLKRFAMPDSAAGSLLMISTVTSLIASPLLGRLGDRRGHKLNLLISLTAYLAAAGMALLAWRAEAMYAVFALMAVSTSAHLISASNLVFELAPHGRRPTYIALSNALPAPFVLAFSLAGGWLAGLGEGYQWPFAASIVLCMASLAVLCTVQTRRREPPQTAS